MRLNYQDWKSADYDDALCGQWKVGDSNIGQLQISMIAGLPVRQDTVDTEQQSTSEIDVVARNPEAPWQPRRPPQFPQLQ